jgi:hypothetical protein
MHKEGYNLVVINSEISYKDALRSGDEFIVTSLNILVIVTHINKMTLSAINA